MTVKNNEVLGYIHCPVCDERGTVHRTKRGKGRYYYKRCGCGCDQRTGKEFQSQLYANTQWLNEIPPPPPDYKEPVPQSVTVEKQESEQSETEEQPKPQPKTKSKAPVAIAAATGIGLLLLGLIGKSV